MLTKPVSKQYIEDLKGRVAASNAERNDSVKVELVSEKSTKTYTKAEVEAMKKKALARKENKEVAVVGKTAVVKEKEVELFGKMEIVHRDLTSGELLKHQKAMEERRKKGISIAQKTDFGLRPD